MAGQTSFYEPYALAIRISYDVVDMQLEFGLY